MRTNLPFSIFAGIAFSISTLCLTACEGTTTDNCDKTYKPKYKLADCQKKVGNFKKGKTTHYVHSEGFEFDLKVVKDTTTIEHWQDFCVIAEEEDREVLLTSDYPIMSVYVTFLGGTEKDSTGVTLGHSKPMTISYDGTSYAVELDSTGSPMEAGIKDDIVLLDTITFNGVTYDSVFKIMDYSHFDALNYQDESFAKGELAHLYFSKTKGILRLETNEGKSFTIKEGGDNE